jgi:hypothetical protein
MGLEYQLSSRPVGLFLVCLDMLIQIRQTDIPSRSPCSLLDLGMSSPAALRLGGRLFLSSWLVMAAFQLDARILLGNNPRARHVAVALFHARVSEPIKSCLKGSCNGAQRPSSLQVVEPPIKLHRQNRWSQHC